MRRYVNFNPNPCLNTFNQHVLPNLNFAIYSMCCAFIIYVLPF